MVVVLHKKHHLHDVFSASSHIQAFALPLCIRLVTLVVAVSQMHCLVVEPIGVVLLCVMSHLYGLELRKHLPHVVVIFHVGQLHHAFEH